MPLVSHTTVSPLFLSPLQHNLTHLPTTSHLEKLEEENMCVLRNKKSVYYRIVLKYRSVPVHAVCVHSERTGGKSVCECLSEVSAACNVYPPHIEQCWPESPTGGHWTSWCNSGVDTALNTNTSLSPPSHTQTHTHNKHSFSHDHTYIILWQLFHFTPLLHLTPHQTYYN